MAESHRDVVAALRHLHGALLHARDQASARVADLARPMEQLAAGGWLAGAVYLGGVLDCAADAPGADVGTVTRAALSVPGGIGTVSWRTDEYAQHERLGELEAYAHPLTSYELCPAATQARLLPEIRPLVGRLIADLEVMVGR